MTESLAAHGHLRECPVSDGRYIAYALRSSQHPDCICPALRACEARVRQDLSSTTAANPRDGAVWKEET